MPHKPLTRGKVLIDIHDWSGLAAPRLFCIPGACHPPHTWLLMQSIAAQGQLGKGQSQGLLILDSMKLLIGHLQSTWEFRQGSTISPAGQVNPVLLPRRRQRQAVSGSWRAYTGSSIRTVARPALLRPSVAIPGDRQQGPSRARNSVTAFAVRGWTERHRASISSRRS